jgi:hypothetical protein
MNKLLPSLFLTKITGQSIQHEDWAASKTTTAGGVAGQDAKSITAGGVAIQDSATEEAKCKPFSTNIELFIIFK